MAGACEGPPLRSSLPVVTGRAARSLRRHGGNDWLLAGMPEAIKTAPFLMTSSLVAVSSLTKGILPNLPGFFWYSML